MSKLSEIVFSPEIKKEVESFNHKVVLRSLTTADNIEMDMQMIDSAEKLSVKELLVLAIKTLSRAIVSVDGVVPENAQDTVNFLNKQTTEVVFDILTKYQSMVGIKVEEIKN